MLFGSTWVVNSIVFFAILVDGPREQPVRAGSVEAGEPLAVLRPARRGVLAQRGRADEHVPRAAGRPKVVASCAVVFVPIFFAGVIFARSFRDSAQPDVDFGSNIAGVILGGLGE